MLLYRRVFGYWSEKIYRVIPDPKIRRKSRITLLRLGLSYKRLNIAYILPKSRQPACRGARGTSHTRGQSRDHSQYHTRSLTLRFFSEEAAAKFTTIGIAIRFCDF